jgi:hypothetical protein
MASSPESEATGIARAGASGLSSLRVFLDSKGRTSRHSRRGKTHIVSASEHAWSAMARALRAVSAPALCAEPSRVGTRRHGSRSAGRGSARGSARGSGSSSGRSAGGSTSSSTSSSSGSSTSSSSGRSPTRFGLTLVGRHSRVRQSGLPLHDRQQLPGALQAWQRRVL